MLRGAEAAGRGAGLAAVAEAGLAERAGLAGIRGLAARRRVRGWSRLRGLGSGSGRRRGLDPGRIRSRGWGGGEAAEYVLALPLAFQIGVLPAAALVYVGGFGGSGSGSASASGNTAVLVLCGALVAATAGLGLGAVRGVPVRVVVLADTVLAVGGNLAVSAVSSGSSGRDGAMSWVYFAGCVALWTLVRGVAGGLGAVVLGAAVRAIMVAGLGLGSAGGGRASFASFAGDVSVLLVAVVVAAAVLVVLDRDAERLRSGVRRSLHDTVLQTLEAIALTLPGDAENATRRLREVRAVAHAEAVALRRELSRRYEARTTPNLVEGLVGLGTELARDGLRMRLDAADSVDGAGGSDGLTAQRRAAVLAAAREALRNVLKHSGVAEALVRVWDEPDGLTVVVRDFGVGFDPAAHQPGFGLSESIAARMAEVGGSAGVGSRVGNGTSVTLWVPVEPDDVR